MDGWKSDEKIRKEGTTQKRENYDEKGSVEKCSKIKKSANLTEENKISIKNEDTKRGMGCSSEIKHADVISRETKKKKPKNSNIQSTNKKMCSSSVKISSRFEDGKTSEIRNRSSDGRFKADKASRASKPAETDLNKNINKNVNKNNNNNKASELPTSKINSLKREKVSVHKRKSWHNSGITRSRRTTTTSRKKGNFVADAIESPMTSKSTSVPAASMSYTSSSSSSSELPLALAGLPRMGIEQGSGSGSSGHSSPHHYHYHHHHHYHNYNHCHNHFHSHSYYYFYNY